MERKETKEKELAYLAEEYKKNPELFKKPTQYDDAKFLGNIGIFLPPKNQQALSPGYVKFWQQDFIVEEIGSDNNIQTIEPGPFLRAKKGKGGPITYATLVKCGLSTIEAVEEIAHLLNIDAGNIKYAGIKDKDAVTSQLISIANTKPEQIQKISSPNFFLKNIHQRATELQVGALRGNMFTILVRTDKSFDKEAFLENIKTIEHEGFYNFYYSQRFSEPRYINWYWGLLILKGDYKNAVYSALFSEGLREIPYFKNTREEIKKNIGNWDAVVKILEPLSTVMHSEIKMAKYLQQHPTDYAGALQQIPEQIKLWLFAYGSLLFNQKVSEYISSETTLPAELPLIFSKEESDWATYYDLLKEDGITEIPSENLKPFPFVHWKQRSVTTKEKVTIHKIDFTDEGVVLNFTLPKGCYATSFLCHLFILMAGMPPENISNNLVDIKKVLGLASASETLEKFKSVMTSRTENAFEKSE